MNRTLPDASHDERLAADTYLVESPPQLINALEAVHAFPSARRNLVILTSPPSPLDAFSPILRDFQWEQVIEMEFRRPDEVGLQLESMDILRRKTWEYRLYLRQRRLREQLNRIAGLLAPARNLFIGNYIKAHMRHFANVLKPEVVYALDDGTDTLRVPILRQQRNHPQAWDRNWNLRQLAHQWLHDWNDARIDRIGLFTIYDLVAHEGDFVVPHAYEFLRSRAAITPESEEFLFLGQPLVEDGYLPEAAHEANLRRVVEYLRGEQLVYVPHRRESAKSVEFVAHELGLPVRRFDVPIEYQIVIRGPRPKALASFFSSAIENSSRIFRDEVSLIAFAPMDSLVRNGPAFVRDTYEHFRQGDVGRVKVVEI